MGRKAALRLKNGHWFSEAGGQAKYFGKASEVPYEEAMARLWQTLAEAKASPKPPSPLQGPTTSTLAEKYLDWLARHRSPALLKEAKRHLGRWAGHFGPLPALAITGAQLEAFQSTLALQGHDPMYVKKHVTSVKACFNKACKLGWLPSTFRPFLSVEAIPLESRPLLESDLPTTPEIQSLLAHARLGMEDIIRFYYHTGARTHELIGAKVGDYQPLAQTLVLGRHKRSRTLRVPTPRIIPCNAEVQTILARHCEGKGLADLIFPTRTGRPYTSIQLDHRFSRIRAKAGVREGITLYSFRHLWISEMLMAGHDALLVARMAGTSVQMLERVYGHFRVQSFTEAQARLDRSRPLL